MLASLSLIQLLTSESSADWEILLNDGNTDGWSKIVRLLLEAGDTILTENFSFPSVRSQLVLSWTTLTLDYIFLSLSSFLSTSYDAPLGLRSSPPSPWRSQAQAAWIPLGVTGVPIKMDEHGLRADHLRETLVEWDTTRPGVKRPKLSVRRSREAQPWKDRSLTSPSRRLSLYITPVGSNPTGTTMPAHRRQEIYDLAVEYGELHHRAPRQPSSVANIGLSHLPDIIIAEDDPYTFLQFPQYTLGDKTVVIIPQSGEDFKKSLVPSFLNFDVQGRVIRLDTFSKTIGPGFRVGYFVANPLFTERLLRSTEVDSQAPSGWSQAILASLLTKWQNSGVFSFVGGLDSSL